MCDQTGWHAGSTQRIQNPPPVTAWEFDSPPGHHYKSKPCSRFIFTARLLYFRTFKLFPHVASAAHPDSWPSPLCCRPFLPAQYPPHNITHGVNHDHSEASPAFSRAFLCLHSADRCKPAPGQRMPAARLPDRQRFGASHHSPAGLGDSVAGRVPERTAACCRYAAGSVPPARWYSLPRSVGTG